MSLCKIILCAWLAAILCVAITSSHEHQPIVDFVTTAITNLTSQKRLLGMCNWCCDRKSTIKKLVYPKLGSPQATITILVLLLSGDIELNPGPPAETIYPCGLCELKVSWSQHAVCCDNCDLWFHKTCIEISSADFEKLADSNISWLCCRCHSANYSDCLFRSFMFDVEANNSFLPLARHQSGTGKTSGVESLNDSFHPPVFSSPKDNPDLHRNNHQNTTTISHPSSRLRSADSIPEKKHNWRTVIINCNSAPGKRALLSRLVDYVDPDCMLLTETKIDGSVSSSEFMPPGYTTFHKD